MSIKAFLIALLVGSIVIIALKIADHYSPIADFKQGLFVGLAAMATYFISEEHSNNEQ